MDVGSARPPATDCRPTPELVTADQRREQPDLALEVDLILQVDPPDDFVAAEVGPFVRSILHAEGGGGAWEVAIVLTSDPELRQLHDRFMGIDSETDVMTFPTDHPSELRGGDVIVSVDRARAQATEAGHSATDEIWFLIAHGLLHLCGWRDDDDDLRTGMHARQTELLARFFGEAGSDPAR